MARILFVINDLGLGGAQKVFVDDATWLAQQGIAVTMVTLYSRKTDQESFLPATNSFSHQSLGLGSSLWAKVAGALKLRGMILEGGFTHVISTLDESNLLTRIAVLGNSKVKSFAREANEANDKAVKIKLIEIFLSLFPVKIIAVSQSVRESILTYTPWMQNKIVVLNNGINLEEETLQDLTPKRAEVQILNVGSLTRKKNQSFLLKAYALVRRELDQSHNRLSTCLVFVGGGEELENLKRHSEDLGISQFCYFEGRVQPEKVSLWYRSSQIFALTSLKEGSPNVILEAMKYKLPVVTTLVGSSGEMVEHGKTGFVHHKNDVTSFAASLLQLVQDQGLRDKMGMAGRIKLEKEFSIEIHRSRLLDILQIRK